MALGLAEMLEGEWLAGLSKTIEEQPNAARFLAPGRPWTIPARQDTFRALRGVAPRDVRVVIFGQDPYPRAESAVGIAFNDGDIKTWTDALNPSFRNIIKNVMMHKREATATTNVVDLRRAIARRGVVAPPDWFRSTAQQGVLWLNTSLTFSSVDQNELKRHTAFWRPIVIKIVDIILAAKRDAIAAGQQAGVAFVLWGGYAKALQTVVTSLGYHTVPTEFVAAQHPAVESFHTINTFDLLEQALTRLGLPLIEWAPTSLTGGGGGGGSGGGLGAATAATLATVPTPTPAPAQPATVPVVVDVEDTTDQDQSGDNDGAEIGASDTEELLSVRGLEPSSELFHALLMLDSMLRWGALDARQVTLLARALRSGANQRILAAYEVFTFTSDVADFADTLKVLAKALQGAA